MATKDVAPLLAKEFVILKLDSDRAPGAAELAKSYQPKEQGLPWMVIVTPDGKAVVDSTGPEGNTGFPAKPSEYAHFKTMLEKAKRHLTDGDIAAIVASLEAANKK
jgi:uncharacterized protein YyaL (SSP411 family)